MSRTCVLHFIVASISILTLTAFLAGQSGNSLKVVPIEATVVARGIPGAGAITRSPATGPGQILDRQRLLVASSSNFGAPLARTDEAPGAILLRCPGKGELFIRKSILH